MRLRNIPGADEAILNSEYCIKEPESKKGNWQSVFSSTQPLHIEIGMGKGRFIMDMAAAHPDINYLGIERYSSVLLRALQKMEETPMPNLKFICMDAADVTEVFAKDEVSRIYLNFSDPWPKDRHAKRRLTSTEFLSRYEKVLPPQGLVEFKTDNTPLFDFSLEQVKEAGWTLQAFTYDLHHNKELNKENIMILVIAYVKRCIMRPEIIPNKLILTQASRMTRYNARPLNLKFVMISNHRS